MTSLSKLIDISSAIAHDPTDPVQIDDLHNEILLPMYLRKNGMIAFEGSLLILPSVSACGVPSLLGWNSSGGWRHNYDISDDITFFSMDAFAGQFGVSSDGIVRFDPETGGITRHSSDLDEWASMVLGDYNYETGYLAAHDWQLRNAPLDPGYRLLPKVPFILGGEYSCENLTSWPMEDAMSQYSALHDQVKSVPDGERLTVRGWLSTKGE